jgi:glutamate 5-kinase
MSARKKPRAKAPRVVIKIGSRALAADPELPRHVAGQVAAFAARGHSFVIVSSGAIAVGCERLGYGRRPKEMGKLQAAAAVGQSILMHRYAEGLANAGLVAAQVLLTHADLADRERVNNARQALAAMLDAGSIPIINENDTVATDEIRFGDNDQLAAMVVPLVGADQLLLLTDVDGVLDAEGRRLRTLDPSTPIANHTRRGGPGTGGMPSKVEAAFKAARSGAAVVIGNATRKNVVTDMLEGADVGTRIGPSESALRARKHWIAYTLRPRGTVIIDAGAAAAIAGGRSSLLSVGVLGVSGQFNAGDAVRIVTPEGHEAGRGLTRLGTLELARAAERRRPTSAPPEDRGEPSVVVHKDDLVTSR